MEWQVATSNDFFLDFESYAVKHSLRSSEIIMQAINGKLHVAFDWPTYIHSSIKEEDSVNIDFYLDDSLIDPELTGRTPCKPPDTSILINRFAVLSNEDLWELLHSDKVVIKWGMVGDVGVEISPTVRRPNLPLAGFKNLFVIFDVNPETKDKPITSIVENSHLRVMGALLELLEEERTKPYNLDLIKTELEGKYRNEISGFSKSTLDKLFAKAKRALKDK